MKKIQRLIKELRNRRKQFNNSVFCLDEWFRSKYNDPINLKISGLNCLFFELQTVDAEGNFT